MTSEGGTAARRGKDSQQMSTFFHRLTRGDLSTVGMTGTLPLTNNELLLPSPAPSPSTGTLLAPPAPAVTRSFPAWPWRDLLQNTKRIVGSGWLTAAPPKPREPGATPVFAPSVRSAPQAPPPRPRTAVQCPSVDEAWPSGDPSHTMVRTPIEGELWQETKQLVADASSEFSGGDSGPLSSWDGCFDDRCYGIEVYPGADRTQFVQRAHELARKRGLPLSISADSQNVMLTHENGNKGSAVQRFAEEVGCSPSEVLKFGDSAGPDGNDASMLTDGNSFNVGDDRPLHPDVQTLNSKGAAGVLDILKTRRSHGPIKAVAADFDGTLADGGMEPATVAALSDLLREGTHVAIITGRSPTAIYGGVEPLLEQARSGTLPPAALDRLHVYAFNGALGVRGREGVALLDADDSKHVASQQVASPRCIAEETPRKDNDQWLLSGLGATFCAF